MRKKDYLRPTMQVVKLQQQTALLQASGQADVQDYNWNDPVEE